MSDLMTMAAATACVQAKLRRDESLALTAAAMVIDNPAMAIAPVIVAIERSRRNGEPRDASVAQSATASGERRSRSTERIGPELVKVPKLDTLGQDEAIEKLRELKLKATVTHNHSTAAKKDKVLMQHPRQLAGVMVEEGSHVHLYVGAGPVEPDPQSEAEAIGEMKTDVHGLKADFGDMKASLAGIQQAMKDLAARTGPSAA